jgi:hypothetical protein
MDYPSRVIPLGFNTHLFRDEGVVGRLSLVFHLIEQPHSNEVNADIVTRVVDVVKTLIIPSYLYVFNETSGATSLSLPITPSNLPIVVMALPLKLSTFCSLYW